jgi:hypothetical protein
VLKQMKKQRNHAPLNMKTQLLLLGNKLKYYFDNFEKVDALNRMTVLKQ